jgi:RimJ/RimL family protein N-acetyltransferase
MTAGHLGQILFRSLKATSRYGQPCLVLPVGEPLKAVLRPIATLADALDPEDVRLLTVWRNRHVKSFLTEFVATEERTAHWLCGPVHHNDGKLLWMVDTPEGERVGHVGLGFIDWNAGYGEADAIVSGGSSPPGLMKASLLTLMQWSRDTLGLKTLAVRVRSDNSALEFYKKVGFNEVRRVPIVASPAQDGVNWTEQLDAPSAEPALVHMHLVFPSQPE